jgi:hypothetical protein
MISRINYKTILTLICALFVSLFVLEKNSVACPVVPDPQIGKVQTNVGKSTWTQQTWDDWQYDTYAETRGSLDTNNVAYAYADVHSGEISLTVRRDSYNSIEFQNVWHGCSPSWASGALYDAFSFSDAVDVGSINVNLQYEGFFDVGDGSDSAFEIEIWGDQGSSSTTVSNNDIPSGYFSVALLDVASMNNDGTYNLGLSARLEAEGVFALAEYGNTYSLSFTSSDAQQGWTVSGTAFDEVQVGSQVPVPSTFFLLAGGFVGLVGLKRKQVM